MTRAPRLASLAATLLPALAAASPYTLISGGTRVGISGWGPDCGPRPGDTTARPGARYASVADGLVPAGAGPALFGPGICRAATGLPQLFEGRSGDGYDCRSRPDSPRRVLGRIDRQVDGPILTIRHRFEYGWALNGSRCALLVHGTWRLEAAPDPAPATTPDSDAPPPRPARCARPGPLAILAIAGAQRRESLPGEAHSLRARATDAAGCALSPTIEWQASAGRIDGTGRFVAPLEGHAEVSARVGARKAAVRFEIRLPEGNLAAAPPPLAPASTRAATRRSAAGVSGARAVVEDDRLPWLRLGFVLLALLASATLLHRLRR